MEIGQLSQPVKPLEVSFAHIAPIQCSLRIYYGKTGAFVEFNHQRTGRQLLAHPLERDALRNGRA